MFVCLSAFVASEAYPLILSAKPGVKVSSPSDLMTLGALGDKHCCFVIERFPKPPMKSVWDLGNFANAMTVCEKKGTLKTFNNVDSNQVNFLEQLENHYSKKLTLISYDECTCKAEKFQEGLIVVRVTEDDTYIVEEVLGKLPEDVTVSFIATTENLFRKK
ncbi:hypothetical protein TVAG_393920 [Trichomonas vaginalis G3]|uniref:Uncharacterized protein n=1 Tax=Trichomonas vaginalis (strain ATCC PRA-98 / G3) TaxID=412133 RepID=A2DWA9_TRIV3|nr:hypothetical protein TVAGG3_0279480 [Trichomonas vaginalis G3]EAY15249.1 hypothetical protein TVAG_393920 [Trichomonas vaginalis G3]KAI5526447.1 hypothetical protein TVAGG3_0279480 [Trichomonas vaginalis G3]|eukprot:XP_001327472.1 hypothetical protein [Trichomonas vaginalis G3]